MNDMVRTTPFTFFGISNRVEHQKLNQVAAKLPPVSVFVVQLSLRQTQALIKIKTIRWGIVPLAILLLNSTFILIGNMASGTLPLLIVLVLISACVCWRPSRTPKTPPGGSSAEKLNQVAALLLPGYLLLPGWVFAVQLDYSCRLISLWATVVNVYIE